MQTENELEAQAHRDVRNKQYQECFEKWKDSPFLKKIDPKHQVVASVVLENQRLYQKQSSFDEKLGLDSVELVAKVMEGLILFDLVSVQPSLGPVCNFYGHQFQYSTESGDYSTVYESSETDLPEIALRLQEWTHLVRTRKVLQEWNSVDDLAFEIRKSITQEVLTDLRNNAGTLCIDKNPDPSYEDIHIRLMEISGILHKKTLRKGRRWIVTSPKIARKLNRAYNKLDVEGSTEPKRCGHLNYAWDVFVDPSWPENKILAGMSEGESTGVLNGYVYGPYVLVGDDKNGSLVARYSKALESPKYYAMLTFGGNEKVVEKGPKQERFKFETDEIPSIRGVEN